MVETRKYTHLNILSPLDIEVNSGTIPITSVISGDRVLSIDLPDGRNFDIGQVLHLNGIPYKINIIDKVHASKYHIRVAHRTKSSMFLLPMFNGSKRLYMYDKLLLNCFIGKNLNTLVLVYRFSSEAVFLRFETALKSFKNFIKSEDPNEHCVLFEFKVPKKWKKDFQLFIDGKYSKFSDEYKMQILDFHDFDVYSQASEILFKAEARKVSLEKKLDIELNHDAELLSIIDKRKEIFNLKDYF